MLDRYDNIPSTLLSMRIPNNNIFHIITLVRRNLVYVKLLYTLLNALRSKCCQGIVWSSMPSWKSWTYRSKHSGY